MANDKAFKVKNGILAQRYLQSAGTETAGSEGYSVLSGTYDSKSFSVTSQETNPHGIFIGSSGTKLFVTGTSSDAVNEYTLSTAYDISSASYVDNFSVAGQTTVPRGLFFKPDGTKFYTGGITTDRVFQYSMSTAWDVSTASYDSKSFLVSTQESTHVGIWFKTDGTKMYILGQGNTTVYQYSLSTAWDVSTASYDSKSYSVSSLGSSGLAVAFNNDGTEMYTTTAGNASFIRVHTLTTAWDVSTASLSGSLDTSISVSVPAGIAGIVFADSGNKMYFSDYDTDNIYQYSTVSYTQTLDLSTGTTFAFTPSGATTVSFTNPPASGLACAFTVEITGGGSTITWPDSVKWHEATAPTATATKELYGFITTDGGTTYYGRQAATEVA